MEVSIFHGLCSFNRNIITNFSHVVAPILEIIKGSKRPFVWSKEVEVNIKFLKNVSDWPILALPNFDQVFQVECDASGLAIGVVLSQEVKPVA